MPSVSYLRLDGKVAASQRFALATRFNGDPSVDLMLLTTAVGGLGLNLTGADVVVFLDHDWNPQKDLQAMDRAHRIGQTKVVNVYRLVTATLEKIMSLQAFKRHLATSVVNQQNASLATMNTEQLLDLFEALARDRDALTRRAARRRRAALSGEDAVGAADAAAAATSGGGGAAAAAAAAASEVLEEVGDLWGAEQWEQFDLDRFVRELD